MQATVAAVVGELRSAVRAGDLELEDSEEPEALVGQRELFSDDPDVPDGELALLGADPPERALHPPHHDFRPEDAAEARAGRALGGHRLPQGRTYALARHLDEPQLGHGVRLGPGPVAAQVGPQLLEHLVAVAPGLHVDEVHHDDAADVAEAELMRHLPRRLDVGLEDGVLRVLLPGVAAGVHVDRGERLGGLDDDVPARRQLDPRLEQGADLVLDVVLVEQRGLALVLLHALDQVGIHLLQVALDLVVELLRVHEQRVDLVTEQVPHDAAGERRLALHQRRRADRRCLARDLLPQAVQVVDLPPALLLGEIVGDRADDPAAGVLGNEARDHLAQPGALLAAFDLAGNTDLGGVRHVHQEPAREGDLGRDPGALGGDGLLGDLDELGLAALQLVGDVRDLAPSAAAPAVAAASVLFVHVFVFGLLVLVVRLDQVGGVQERALLRPDVDEGRLDAGQHRFDAAQIDVAHAAAGVGTIDQELNKAVVLQDRHAGLARRSVDEYLSLQHDVPRPPPGSTRPGVCDCGNSRCSRLAGAAGMNPAAWPRG